MPRRTDCKRHANQLNRGVAGSTGPISPIIPLAALRYLRSTSSLALNLMHDIVTGEKNVGEAREYYAKEFLDCPAQGADAVHGRAPLRAG